MAKRVGISIEVNENGTVVTKRVGDGFTEAARRIERNTRDSFSRMNVGVGRQLDELTTKMVRWGTLAAAVFGGLALRSITRLGTEFQTRMSAVGAFANATGAEFDKLRAQALALGEATVFTATNAAEAMEQLGLAGFKTTEILKVMPDVLSLAAAGSLDMASAAEISSNVIRQMGLDASQFGKAVDTLAFSASESTTTIQELGVAFSYAGNVARTMGLKVEDVASALALLANQGVQGERAGTGLVRILSVMLGQTEEGEKGLGKFNLKLFDQAGAFVGLSEAMRQMQAAGMKTQDIMEAFGQRGGPTMLALLNAGSKTLADFTEKTKSAGGFAQDMATKLRDNLGGDAEQLTGVLQTLALTMFDKVTPALRSVVQSAAELGRSWAEMLRGSDVLSGLERAATLLSITLGVVLVNAARRAALAMVEMGTAAAVSTLKFVAGVTAMDAALLATMPIMEAVAVTSRAMWAAIGGLALAIGAITYQATRAILELTGLDSAIEAFFTRVLNRGGDAPDVLRNFQEGLALIDKTIDKLGSKGISFALDVGALDEVRKNVEQLQQVVKNGVRMHFSDKDLAPLNQALADATRQSREVLQLSSQFGPRFSVAWTKAAEGSKTLEDRIAKVKELLQGGTASPTGTVAPKVDEEAVKQFQQAMKEFDSALTQSGGTSAKILADTAERFALLGRVADKEKVPLTAFAKAFQKDLVALMESAKKAGLVIPESLLEVGTEALRLRDLDLDQTKNKAAIEALNGQIASVGLTTKAAVDEFMSNWDRMAKVGDGDASAQMVAAFKDELIELGKAAEKSGVQLPEALERAIASAKKLDAAAKDIEGWKQLNQQLLDVGVVSRDTAEAMTTQLGEALRIGAEHGIAATDVYRAHRDELEQLVEAYMVAGQEIPAAIQEAFDGSRVGEFMESIRQSSAQFVLNVTESWAQFTMQAEASFAHMVGQFAVYGGSLAEMSKNLFKQLAAQVIQMLVQWGLAKIALGKINTAVATSEASTNLAAGLAQVFVNSMASAAAIPFVGWAMAPEVGAANLAIATAGAAGAAAAGAAIGAGIGAAGIALAEGGITRGPIRPLIGERGAEAVVPLTGAPARRAAKAMGIGQSGGDTVALTLNVHGDNWRDGGIADDLLEKIHDGLNSLIRRGRRPAFKYRTA